MREPKSRLGKKFAFYTQFASKNLRQVLEGTRKNALAYDHVASGGSFLSIDPVTTDANTGDSFNRYNYANNNPLKYIDPDGREARAIEVNCMPGNCTLLRYTNDVARGVSTWLNDARTNAIFNDLNIDSNGCIKDGNVSICVGPAAVEAVGAKVVTTVIGRVNDLKRLVEAERSLVERLPNKGSPKANWAQNSGVLREEMRRGQPIRDASPGDLAVQFLNAERNLLRERGWTFDGKTNFWNPPK